MLVLIFLGRTRTKQWIKCLAQGHNTVIPPGGETRTCNSSIPSLTLYQLNLYTPCLNMYIHSYSIYSYSVLLVGFSIHLFTYFLYVSNDGSGKTANIPRLIWGLKVFKQGNLTFSAFSFMSS